MSERVLKSRKGNRRRRDQPKPPHSYIALITTAILSSPRKKLTLTEINKHLVENYEFFRGTYQGWKNSVRHNLSFNKCFVKILKDPSRPWGKDNYWTVMLDSLQEYVSEDGNFRRRRKRQSRAKGMDKSSQDHSMERREDKQHSTQDEIRNDLRSDVDNNMYVKSNTGLLTQSKGNIDLNRFSIDRLLEDNNNSRFGQQMFGGLTTRFQGNTRQVSDHQIFNDSQHYAWERRVSPFLNPPHMYGQTTPIGPPSWIPTDPTHHNKNYFPYLPRSQAITHHYYV